MIGIGEIAVSDHRSSQPSFEEFTRAVADARVGACSQEKQDHQCAFRWWQATIRTLATNCGGD